MSSAASLGGSTQIAEGMFCSSKQNAMTIQAMLVPGGVDVGLEPGFMSHAISVPLIWNRVPPDARQHQTHLDGVIGWVTEDQLWLASG